MASIGVKKNGSPAAWFVPDGQIQRWRALGNRIIRKARPEDGTSDKIALLSSLKKPEQIAVSVGSLQMSAAPVVVVVEQENRPARRRRRAE